MGRGGKSAWGRAGSLRDVALPSLLRLLSLLVHARLRHGRGLHLLCLLRLLRLLRKPLVHVQALLLCLLCVVGTLRRCRCRRCTRSLCCSRAPLAAAAGALLRLLACGSLLPASLFLPAPQAWVVPRGC